jgi:predicted metal-binding protein
VLLCRGCCCGTAGKHPRTDHDAQQLALEAAAEEHPDVELRVVDCLDECDRSNVAVLRRPGAPAAERDTWLGGLLTDRATGDLARWVADGGAAPLPPALAGLRFRRVPPRRRR